MIEPMYNNCLIEVIDEFDGVLGSSSENVQKGILRDFKLTKDHLTASTGYSLNWSVEYETELKSLIGKTVYWQEYADAGSKFVVDGKDYVIVPFYRLIAKEK
jgi:hypothetical protein